MLLTTCPLLLVSLQISDFETIFFTGLIKMNLHHGGRKTEFQNIFLNIYIYVGTMSMSKGLQTLGEGGRCGHNISLASPGALAHPLQLIGFGKVFILRLLGTPLNFHKISCIPPVLFTIEMHDKYDLAD